MRTSIVEEISGVATNAEVASSETANRQDTLSTNAFNHLAEEGTMSEPEIAAHLLNQGNELLNQERIEEAVQTYRRALHHDPGSEDTHYNIAIALARLGKDYQSKEVGIVAICSNDAARYPEDAPDQLRLMAKQLGYTFPVCYDESQETAKVFAAACTPDFFLFDQDRKLVYRGQLDDSRPGTDKPVTGKDVRMALDAVLSERSMSPDQKPSAGCSIKWKPGNEPNFA